MPNQSEFLPPSAYRPARWFPNDVRGANHAFASSINASMYAARCDAVTQTRMSSANLTSTKRPPTSSKSISSGHTPPTKHPFQHGTKQPRAQHASLSHSTDPLHLSWWQLIKRQLAKHTNWKLGLAHGKTFIDASWEMLPESKHFGTVWKLHRASIAFKVCS